MTKQTDTPLPSRKALCDALEQVEFAKWQNTYNHALISHEQMNEIIEAAKWALHAIPSEMDFIQLDTQNPINQVYFRAGLLACREYMARFVEQGGDAVTAASIRANWWPQLGDDPGAPRLFDFVELADEHADADGNVTWTTKAISPSIEALPRGYQFLLPQL